MTKMHISSSLYVFKTVRRATHYMFIEIFLILMGMGTSVEG